MLSILITILPIFVVMGVGYIAARSGYLNPALADPLNAFAVRIAVPALLFRAMLSLDLSRAFQIPVLVAFYAGAITSFVVAIALARIVWKRRPGESVAVGFCALFSNTVLLGLPIMQRVYGEEFLAPAYGILSLHAGLIYTIGMVTMEFARRDGKPVSETLLTAFKSIIANPLMIAVIAGICFNLAGIKPEGPLMAPVNMLADAAIPVALVGIGAALTRYRLGAETGEALMVSALSLLLHPLVAFVLAYFLFALPAEFVRAAVVMAAMPPGVNIYIFAVLYNRAVNLSASVIVLATLLSVTSIALWIWVLQFI